MRLDLRKTDQLRPIQITRNFTKYAPGSVLIKSGETVVLCSATVEQRVPPFLKGQNSGWLTAEYSMLPSSTQERKRRELSRGKPEGRTMEIQRLIGRSLRAVVDLEKLGEHTIWIDCDVIQADGGTRTASITGAYVALCDAVNSMLEAGQIKENPITSQIAAVSVGIVDEQAMLDLCYVEDSHAEVDANFVMTDQLEIVEIQGTAEGRSFNKTELDNMYQLAEVGIKQLLNYQQSALGE